MTVLWWLEKKKFTVKALKILAWNSEVVPQKCFGASCSNGEILHL